MKIKASETMKIRCSALGKIMTNSRRKGELSKTAQSYVIKCLKEEQYGKRILFSSKQTVKGNIMEEQAIKLLSATYDLPFIEKNEQRFENGYITGTPDIITPTAIRDVKCSWSLDTFPIYESELPNSDYYWQMQGYMWLTDRPVAMVDYCLMDTPTHLLESEYRIEARKQGVDELTDEQRDKIDNALTYSDVDDEMRIVTFVVVRDEQAIKRIMERILECDNFKNQIINN